MSESLEAQRKALGRYGQYELLLKGIYPNGKARFDRVFCKQVASTAAAMQEGRRGTRGYRDGERAQTFRGCACMERES